jgi:hypothetical protein
MEADYISQNFEQPVAPSPQETNANLDHLLHLKSRILRSKLEVLASEIYTRLNLWDRNLGRINDEKTRVEQMLARFAQLANYHLREQKDQTPFYQQIFDLEAERRSQDVECWRDIFNIMRDFLESWEAHEQAKARAIFLNHAGPGLESYM